MNIKITFVVFVIIVSLTTIGLYSKNYYVNGDSKDHARVSSLVRDYLQKKYPDKKFVVKFKSWNFWYTLRKFAVSTEDEPHKEYSILTEQDTITMDEYTETMKSRK